MPYKAVLWTSFAILIAVLVNYLFPDKALMYLLMIATCAILITWFIILISQIRFRKIKTKTDEHLKFKLRLFPYTSIFAILMLFTVMGVMTTMDDMKLSIYVTPFWILLLSIFFILRNKNNSSKL